MASGSYHAIGGVLSHEAPMRALSDCDSCKPAGQKSGSMANASNWHHSCGHQTNVAVEMPSQSPQSNVCILWIYSRLEANTDLCDFWL